MKAKPISKPVTKTVQNKSAEAPTQDLQSQLSVLIQICTATLSALPRVSTDPDKQPKISDLPAQVNKVVDLFEQVASNLELAKGLTILDLPQHSANLMSELKQLRAAQHPA